MRIDKNITIVRLVEELISTIFSDYKTLVGSDIQIPIPINDIIDKLFGLRVDKENFNNNYKNFSGLLFPHKRWIIIEKKDPSTRQRFTLAHELAHWIINYDNKTKYSSYSNFLKKVHSKKIESIADYFAAAILIPSQFLIDELKNIDKCNTSNQIIEVANKLQVSPQVVKIRIDEINSPYFPHKYGTINFQISNIRNTTDLLINHIIFLDCEFIDHNIIRNLFEIKKHHNNIYIKIDRDNYNLVDALLEIDLIDGICYNTNKSSDNQSILYKKIIISNRCWQSKLFQSNEQQFKFKTNSLALFARDSYESRQRKLIDIGRIIIMPKLNYRNDVKDFVKVQHKENKNVVIVTGCFDLINSAHIKFLRRAKHAGDILIVGVEDDLRVRAFKGDLRPVNTIHQRIEVLDAIEFIDFTFVIAGSPKYDLVEFYSRLHKKIGADILAVTDGDPNIEDRRVEIEAAGGELRIVSKIEENSTTSILRNLIASYEYPNLEIVSKKKLLRYSIEKNSWEQMILPFIST